MMAELSEAEKAEALALAQAKQGVADPEPAAPVPVREEPVNTVKIAPENFPDEVAITSDPLPAAPPRPQTPTSGSIEEWGPYEDYQIINTGFGEFGLEKGKILFFEPGQVFNKRAGQFVAIRIPRYRLPDQTQEDAINQAVMAEDLHPVRG